MQEKAGICCPADELMSIVTKNYLAELKSVLKFQPKFNEHTQKVKNEVAQSLNSTLDQITFVGIHNRRTVNKFIWIFK